MKMRPSLLKTERRTEGRWSVGRSVGWTDGRTDRQTDEEADKKTVRHRMSYLRGQLKRAKIIRCHQTRLQTHI